MVANSQGACVWDLGNNAIANTHTHTLCGLGGACVHKQKGRGQHPQCPQYRVGRIFCSSSGLGVMVQILIPGLCCCIHTDRRPECHPPQETHHRRFAICTVSSISGCQLPAGYHTTLCSLLCRQNLQWPSVEPLERFGQNIQQDSSKSRFSTKTACPAVAKYTDPGGNSPAGNEWQLSGNLTVWQSQWNRVQFGLRCRYILVEWIYRRRIQVIVEASL